MGKNGQNMESRLKKLSESLYKGIDRGFFKTNLEYARRFYLTYADRISCMIWLQNGYKNFETTETINIFGKYDNRKSRKHAICHARFPQPNP